MLLSIQHLNFGYGSHTIFKDLSITVQEKEKIGLIGDNGSGKTTFFNLLTHALLPDNGTIHRKQDITIGYLQQEPPFEPGQTLHAFFLSHFSTLLEMENQMQVLQDRIDRASADEQPALAQELSKIQETYAEKGGYEYPSRIRGVTIGLGFKLTDLEKPIDTFSGGQKTRIALGALLLSAPDLLMLDEPTNYLDLQTVAWLESYLKSYPNAFIVISHDRYFLNHVCSRIIEITDHQFLSFEGNYSDFLVKKHKYNQARQAAIARNNKEMARQQAIIDQLRSRHSVKNIKRAKSRETKLAKMTYLQEAQADHEIQLRFEPPVRSADDVLQVSHLVKSFDQQTVIEDLSFDVFRGDKIGIIGPNGAGKSTLLKLLMRQFPADSGRLIFGQKVQTGYYSQEAADSDAYGAATLIDALRSVDTHLSDGAIRRILARFLFTGDSVFKATADLSGGEMARLRLAMLMISDANFLLLDEPTNHIDMATKEILEDALADYEGTLLAVSHDRYFLNKVATKILALSPGRTTLFEGNYDDYYQWLAQMQAVRQKESFNASEKTKTAKRKNAKAARALEQNRKRKKNQLKTLEKKIEACDGEIANLESLMCRPDFYDDAEQAAQIAQDYEALKKESNHLLNQWEELALDLEDA
jgi:ATP-binding cassette subfamily F protein 3